MARRIDITGERFGKLVVLGYSHTDYNGATWWKCQCECGNQAIALKGEMKRGKKKSCGCMKRGRR